MGEILHTVYLVRNIENGKVYVGQTIRTLHRRWMTHINNSNSGSNQAFARAIRKYGPTSFRHEVLGCCETQEESNRLETYWIIFLQSKNPENGYNETFGGDGRTGWKMPQEVVDKIRASNVGKKRTAEQCLAMSRARKGKNLGPFSEEHKKNLSASRQGIIFSAKHRENLTAANRKIAFSKFLKTVAWG